MATLNDREKLWIVERLACFYTHSEVQAGLRDTFKVSASLQQIQRYDVTRANGATLSPTLKKVFDETRERYLKVTEDIPIASQAYRLQQLQRLLENCGRNADLGLRILEQAAKEVGGVFTRRRELTGRGGGPIEVSSGPDFEGWSLAELETYAEGGMPALVALRSAAIAQERGRNADNTPVDAS